MPSQRARIERARELLRSLNAARAERARGRATEPGAAGAAEPAAPEQPQLEQAPVDESSPDSLEASAPDPVGGPEPVRAAEAEAPASSDQPGAAPAEPGAEGRLNSEISDGRLFSLADLEESRGERIKRHLQRLRGRFEGGPGARWRELPALARQRILAALVVAATAALVGFVLIPVAPCWVPGGDSCAPGNDAIAHVPDDALLYAHLNIDPDSEQVQAAGALRERLPLLVAEATAALVGAGGVPIDFAGDVAPWSGGELALAVLPGGTRLERVLMIESDDDEAAAEFATDLVGAPTLSTDLGDGIEVFGTSGQLVAALDDGFLVIGELGAVTDLIEGAEPGSTLSDSAEVAEIFEDLPEQRIADLYLSPDGARALLGEGPVAPFDTFIDAAATTGAAAAIELSEDSVEVAIRSALDLERSEAAPGFFAALPRFEPTLTAQVDAEALGYLGLGDPQASISALLDQAASDAPGLLEGFERFETRLGRQGGAGVERDLLPLLGGEAAFSIQPALGVTDAPEATPGVLPGGGVPTLSLIASGVDAQQAQETLARLQEPITAALDPVETGRAPLLETTEIAGVETRTLQVSPVVEVSYATVGEQLVIATDPAAIESAVTDGERLAEAPDFEAVTEGLPEDVSLLAYLDVRGLIGLGEQIGLAEDPAYAAVSGDLRALEEAALSVQGGGDALSTDLRITVGERELASPDAPPLGDE